MRNIRLGLLGLGYVGLPLYIEFSKYFKTIGFDLNRRLILNLKKNYDENNQFNINQMRNSQKNGSLTSNPSLLKNCNFYIVCVPTPVNSKNFPDLKYIYKSLEIISGLLKQNDIVVFESTVYPGLTEEICAPFLEKKTNLIFNKDFFLGYSPERINPGDKFHSLRKITKVISGSNKKTTKTISKIYSQVLDTKLYISPSIKIAEASKVIENIQRDINIAFMNELAVIFDKMNINLIDVLNASKTKWNFLTFYPGLVGGHCIGVDPYYLTYKSKKLGYKPEVILSGRKINNTFSKFLSLKIKKELKNNLIFLNNAKILILGVTFKENISDYRNTKVIDLRNHLKKSVKTVDLWDDHVNKSKFFKETKIKLNSKINQNYDCIIIAVKHKNIKQLGLNFLKSKLSKDGFIFDLKYLFYPSKECIYL